MFTICINIAGWGDSHKPSHHWHGVHIKRSRDVLSLSVTLYWSPRKCWSQQRQKKKVPQHTWTDQFWHSDETEALSCSTLVTQNDNVFFNWNLCSDSNLSPYLQAPEPGALQLQVTHYNFSYTTDNEKSFNETLPSCKTSFDITVTDGVQYTITVSALSNGRESQNNPQLKFGMFSACTYGHIMQVIMEL